MYKNWTLEPIDKETVIIKDKYYHDQPIAMVHIDTFYYQPNGSAEIWDALQKGDTVDIEVTMRLVEEK